MNGVIRMCQFRKCGKEADKRFFCPEHTCNTCNLQDGDLVYVKKAHVIFNMNNDKVSTCCGGVLARDNIGPENYCYEHMICKYHDCENYKSYDFTCFMHVDIMCLSCLNKPRVDKYRCSDCQQSGKYRCDKCKNVYKYSFMYNNILCHKCSYNNREVVHTKISIHGEYIENIYNYKSEIQYPIKLYKYFNRHVRDPFYNSLISLSQELISIILNYANLQPSYITLLQFISLHKIKKISI